MKQKIIKPSTLKGFRDFFPHDCYKRQHALDIIKKTFELYGFVPIETPALEYLEVFEGSIGEDEKLFYKFRDPGGRNVALRYDQTVPACRFIAQYPDKITLPFKRYQVQTVWRAEKPQKGRYREFLQCDADIFGIEDRTADAETIALTIDIFKNLGFKNVTALINDRELYRDIPYKAVTAIDKLEKIKKQGVIEELVLKGYSHDDAGRLIERILKNKPNKNLLHIFNCLDSYGFTKNYRFKPELARSFSYSTGTIWEITVPEFKGGSLAGCERFDSLISKFSKKQVAAVGFAVGFDRTILAMEELGLFKNFKSKTQVLITVFSPEFLPHSQKIARQLRLQNINTDLYPDTESRLDKQLKYADRNMIPYVLIIGPQEVEKKTVLIKDLTNGNQFLLKANELARLFHKKA